MLNSSNGTPLTKDMLATILGISEREVRALIEELRNEGQPICNATKGYYIAKTIPELELGIRFYASPIMTQLKTLESMNRILHEWKNKESEQLKIF